MLYRAVKKKKKKKKLTSTFDNACYTISAQYNKMKARN